MVQRVASASLVCSDMLVLTNGDTVRANARHVQKASLNGESLPITKDANAQSISTAGCGLWAVGCGLWAVGCGLWAVGCGL